MLPSQQEECYKPRQLHIIFSSEMLMFWSFRSKAFSASLRACLRGGRGLQIGEVTCGRSPHLSCKRDQIKKRDYTDRQVTPPKRVTSPTWGPPPPCKQALNMITAVKKLNKVFLVRKCL